MAPNGMFWSYVSEVVPMHSGGMFEHRGSPVKEVRKALWMLLYLQALPQ